MESRGIATRGRRKLGARWMVGGAALLAGSVVGTAGCTPYQAASAIQCALSTPHPSGTVADLGVKYTGCTEIAAPFELYYDGKAGEVLNAMTYGGDDYYYFAYARVFAPDGTEVGGDPNRVHSWGEPPVGHTFHLPSTGRYRIEMRHTMDDTLVMEENTMGLTTKPSVPRLFTLVLSNDIEQGPVPIGVPVDVASVMREQAAVFTHVGTVGEVLHVTRSSLTGSAPDGRTYETFEWERVWMEAPDGSVVPLTSAVNDGTWAPLPADGTYRIYLQRGTPHFYASLNYAVWDSGTLLIQPA
jgi:hypothetical protein